MSFAISKTFQTRLANQQMYFQQKLVENSQPTLESVEEKSNSQNKPQQAQPQRFSALTHGGSSNRIQINSQYSSDMY